MVVVTGTCPGKHHLSNRASSGGLNEVGRSNEERIRGGGGLEISFHWEEERQMGVDEGRGVRGPLQQCL